MHLIERSFIGKYIWLINMKTSHSLTFVQGDSALLEEINNQY